MNVVGNPIEPAEALHHFVVSHDDGILHLEFFDFRL